MGYAHYLIVRNGQAVEAGYAVAAECDQSGCTVEIRRGLDALCGETPGGDEHGCGGYFCDDHLHIPLVDQDGYLCGGCMPDDEDDPDEDGEDWQPGRCDRCTGGDPIETPIGLVYCACRIGQGADPENCACGPAED
ncbi:hypothetical protein ACFVXG_07745 [Kitasatospora sp. NPDC058162]|uniref:hypothetical protein n=1 Tax=Kitasatospora sp. NPDC058162 TaxID=3346362 RepID=UPI0036DD6E93